MYSQGNVALTANTVVALSSTSQIWKDITFMLAGSGSGYCVLVGASDGADTDDDAATRKGVTLYHTGDATANAPFVDLKRFHMDGPIDLKVLAAIASAANQLLHWFGNKISG